MNFKRKILSLRPFFLIMQLNETYLFTAFVELYK